MRTVSRHYFIFNNKCLVWRFEESAPSKLDESFWVFVSTKNLLIFWHLGFSRNAGTFVYVVLECQLNPGRRIFKDSLFTAGRVRIFVTNLWPTGRSNLAPFMQSLPKRARYSTVRSPMPTWHYEPIAIRIWVTGTAVPPDRWFCIYIVKFNC